MQPHQSKRKSKFSLIFFGLWFLALGVGFMQRQAILDFVALRNYTPSSQVAELATQTTMTDNARKVFYVNAPEIVNKTTFPNRCPSAQREKTIVLGCYHGNQQGIFLLDVKDERLNGVVQVTAAHEMLHAYYDRLSTGERKRVDAMLTDFYTNKLKDERVKETIEGYKKSEPLDVVNEMHSIFATEIADLPRELDEYYDQYFSNRRRVTDYAAKYENEFTTRKAAVATADAQLTTLKKQIEDTETRLKAQQDQIAQQRANLDVQQENGNIAAYNAGVPGYNALVNSYNTGVKEVQALVAQYNELVAARNQVAAEISQLSSALDSDVTPIKR